MTVKDKTRHQVREITNHAMMNARINTKGQSKTEQRSPFLSSLFRGLPKASSRHNKENQVYSRSMIVHRTRKQEFKKTCHECVINKRIKDKEICKSHDQGMGFHEEL